MSDAANWSRVRELFGRALDLDPALRAAFLREACGDDSVLHAEVSSLLAAHVDAGSMAEGSPLAALDASAVQSLIRGLRAGDRLGPYDIVGPLGAGGMGEVFEARDTLLTRRVAIKILSAELALDGSARDRLVREAKALASLNHPNIAQIHGLEVSNGVTALVMELIEGDDLSHRVARGPLPIDRALAIARQIAEALEAAHVKGIIHRDLKPANIKVTATGTVKVLDFGLAKALDRDRAADDVTSMATRPGTILGTPVYMSPEQVRGEDVDTRTDVWALGCVLFEVLTGRRAFGGGTPSDCIAAVLEREPDWSALPPATPPSIRALLRRCLQKDRTKRLRDVGDARFALEDAALAPEPVGKTQSGNRPVVMLALLGLAAAALAVVGIPAVRHLRETPPPETRTEIVTPATEDPASFALSPDGRQMVIVASDNGGSRLWLRSLATTTAQPLAGTEGARLPFWSPDGRSVGFFTGNALKRLDLGGGAPQTLAPVVAALGGTWNADGVILFAPSMTDAPLMRVSATNGGATVAVMPLGPQQLFLAAPHFLPDGRRFLFYMRMRNAPDTSGIYLGALDGSAPTLLTATDSDGVYLPEDPGWLLWVRSGTLVAQRLDLSKAALTGEPVTLADGVAHDLFDGFGRGAVSVATTGLVAYRTDAGSRRQLTWVDRSGTVQGTVGDPDGSLSNPRVSPEGRRVIVSRTAQGNTDLWLLDGARTSRFTFDAGTDQSPAWSPDGTRIVFYSNRQGRGDIYQKHTSSAGAEERLVVSEQVKVPNHWSADSRFLLYLSVDPQTSSDLWVAPMTGDGTPSVYLKTPFREVWGTFSPDGRWVAFQSNLSGQPEIYIRPFVPPGAAATALRLSPGPAAGAAERQWQVSTGGGVMPVWRPDGKELYYLNPAGAMMAAPITVAGAALAPGAPVVLFPTRIFGGGADLQLGRQYDVAVDGRFLINTVLANAAAPITLLQNWHPEEKH